MTDLQFFFWGCDFLNIIFFTEVHFSQIYGYTPPTYPKQKPSQKNQLVGRKRCLSALRSSPRYNTSNSSALRNWCSRDFLGLVGWSSSWPPSGFLIFFLFMPKKIRCTLSLRKNVLMYFEDAQFLIHMRTTWWSWWGGGRRWWWRWCIIRLNNRSDHRKSGNYTPFSTNWVYI